MLFFVVVIDFMCVVNCKFGVVLFCWCFVIVEGVVVWLIMGFVIEGLLIVSIEGCDLLIVVVGFNLLNYVMLCLFVSFRWLKN